MDGELSNPSSPREPRQAEAALPLVLLHELRFLNLKALAPT